MSLKLYIGNYNYSSWSLRPWLVLRKSELPFEEDVIDLDVPGFKDKLLALSDAGTVPVLEVNGDKVEAIRVTKLMHEGFPHLREEAPMNLRRRTSKPVPQNCLDDAAEMVELWDDLLSRHDGPFLFNAWSIADAFYTPAATRFASYDLPRTARSDTYISELMSDPDFQDWEANAFIESHILPDTDKVNQ